MQSDYDALHLDALMLREGGLSELESKNLDQLARWVETRMHVWLDLRIAHHFTAGIEQWAAPELPGFAACRSG